MNSLTRAEWAAIVLLAEQHMTNAPEASKNTASPLVDEEDYAAFVTKVKELLTTFALDTIRRGFLEGFDTLDSAFVPVKLQEPAKRIIDEI